MILARRIAASALCALPLAAAIALLSEPRPAPAQIPGTANIQVGGTNIIGGTNGRCLYDNAGKVGETASCGLAGGITIGASVITGGTNGRLLFDSSGVVGEQAVGTGVTTALGTNVGTAGAFVTNGGALGTPASGVATNLTGTASGLTAGTVTTNANLTGDTTSSGNATTTTKINGVDQTTAWSVTTPVPTAGSGTFTTATASVGTKQIGKTVIVRVTITVTAVNTASGSMFAAVPVNNLVDQACSAMNQSNSGVNVVARISGNSVGIFPTAGTIANNVYTATCVYEST